nr:alpha/beta hydrolase [Chelatococcus reniformis]
MPVTTGDGRVLRAVRWPAAAGAAEVKGTVLILQGRAEFLEKYFETVGDLLARGFAVVTFDWRGQGGSERELANPAKGHVDDFSLYRLDLEAVLDQAVSPAWPQPLFGLAHSMGGAVLLQALSQGFDRFARVVTIAPMVDIALIAMPRLARALAQGLDVVGLGTAYVPGGGARSIQRKPFAGNRVSGDAVRYARNAAAARPDIAVGDPTISWLNAAFRCMATLTEPRFGAAITTPILVIGAGEDRIVSTLAVERFATRLKSGHAIVIPASLHEVLMEREPIRDAFFAAFDAFIPGSTVAPATAAAKAAG